MKTSLWRMLLFSFLILAATNSRAQTITSASVIFVTPDCDGCDDKDHDTKIGIAVYGAFGLEVANTHYGPGRDLYDADIQFVDDGSEHEVPLVVASNNTNGAGAFAQKIRVSIIPNGRALARITPKQFSNQP